jgi:hypothetical protein
MIRAIRSQYRTLILTRDSARLPAAPSSQLSCDHSTASATPHAPPDIPLLRKLQSLPEDRTALLFPSTATSRVFTIRSLIHTTGCRQAQAGRSGELLRRPHKLCCLRRREGEATLACSTPFEVRVQQAVSGPVPGGHGVPGGRKGNAADKGAARRRRGRPVPRHHRSSLPHTGWWTPVHHGYLDVIVKRADGTPLPPLPPMSSGVHCAPHH